jgi:hypothetical protein
MNTDQMIEQEIKQAPVIQLPRVKRESGIHQRLREKLSKSKNLISALNFAREILSYGTKPSLERLAGCPGCGMPGVHCQGSPDAGARPASAKQKYNVI